MTTAHQVEELLSHSGWQPLVIFQAQLVELEFTQSRTNALQVSDKVRELLDGFNLLLKELPLDEVHHLPKNNT